MVAGTIDPLIVFSWTSTDVFAVVESVVAWAGVVTSVVEVSGMVAGEVGVVDVSGVDGVG
jgi:hypothetical protein